MSQATISRFRCVVVSAACSRSSHIALSRYLRVEELLSISHRHLECAPLEIGVLDDCEKNGLQALLDIPQRAQLLFVGSRYGTLLAVG